MKNKEIYRHYGSDKFEIDKFTRITNREYSNKPFGGRSIKFTISMKKRGE